jgi:hypothetical protein
MCIQVASICGIFARVIPAPTKKVPSIRVHNKINVVVEERIKRSKGKIIHKNIMIMENNMGCFFSHIMYH